MQHLITSALLILAICLERSIFAKMFKQIHFIVKKKTIPLFLLHIWPAWLWAQESSFFSLMYTRVWDVCWVVIPKGTPFYTFHSKYFYLKFLTCIFLHLFVWIRLFKFCSIQQWQDKKVSCAAVRGLKLWIFINVLGVLQG